MNEFSKRLIEGFPGAEKIIAPIGGVLIVLVVFYHIDSGLFRWSDANEAATSDTTTQQYPMTAVPQADGSHLIMPVTSQPQRIVQGLETQMLNAPACDYHINAMKSVAYGSNPENIKMLQLEKMVQAAQKAGCL